MCVGVRYFFPCGETRAETAGVERRKEEREMTMEVVVECGWGETGEEGEQAMEVKWTEKGSE